LSAFGLSGEADAWLSAQMGRPALRVRVVSGGGDPALAHSLRETPVFATVKLPADAVAACVAAQDMGFRLVDTNLLFERQSGTAQGANVRAARPDDLPAVAAIARQALVRTRFHLDPAIPAALAGDIKAAWAANFFAGKRGDAMLIAERDGVPAGFLLALRAHAGWTVDLIAVAPDAQGLGLGRSLIAGLGGLAHGAEPPGALRAGTQAANRDSLAFYARQGFSLVEASYVLHHHGRSTPYPERSPS
jgi:GNAT superfamily N-acetyltransferase